MAGVRERDAVVVVPHTAHVRRGHPVQVQVEALVTELPVGTEHVFRAVRIAVVHAVAAVDDTVAAEVLVHAVAGIHRIGRLGQVRIQALHAVLVRVEVALLVQALELVQHVPAGGTAGLALVLEFGLDLVLELDGVPGEGDVGVQVVGELADVVLPAELDLITLVVHLAEVHVREGGGDDGRERARGDEDARAVFLEDIAGEVQAVVEQVEVQTDIGLERGLPGNALVARGAQLVARHAVALAGAEVVRAGIVPDAVHVHEADGVALVVTDEADGGAELQEVDPLGLLHELFLGDHPAQGTGREQAVAGLARGEVLGTVVTGGEVDEVLVGIPVGGTGDPAHIAVRQPGIFRRIVVAGLVV